MFVPSLRLRVLVAFLLLTLLVPFYHVSAAPPVGRIFTDTGHMLDPQFTAYYNTNNGARALGSPITESYQENGRLVQMFQQGRLEYDATNQQVTPAPLGRLLTAGRAPDPAALPPVTDLTGLYDTTTGHSVAAVFAAYWKQAGAGATIGRPISEPSTVTGLTTQYFEFARLIADETGQISARLQDNVPAAGSPFAAVPQPADSKGLLYVAATGHSVRGGFLEYYQALGGAATLGAPISEEAWEDGLTVQYFERSKLEWHRDAPAGQQIVLSALGQMWLIDHPAPAAALAPAPIPVATATPAPTATPLASAAPAGLQVLSSATTSFHDSIPGRVHNLVLATSRFNGVVVPAGATFSFNKTLGNDGASAGFVIAKIIYNGRTIDGIGGGICQVATTNFRAAFLAGMDIVERHPHTYRVSFYEPPVGFDATVFSDQGVDLRWRNNLDVPITIQTKADMHAQTITFTFLASQSPRYKATFSGPVIVNKVPHPPDIYENDPTLPVGKVVQTEHAKDGLTTRIQRTLTDPATGTVIRVETYTSVYVPWANRFSRGTKGAKPPAPKPTATPAAPPIPTVPPTPMPGSR